MDQWKYDYFVEQLHRTAYKRHECFVISSLFHDPRLLDLKPITQHYVRIGRSYALLDLYYPQLNFAVEIDEPHHSKVKESDLTRQQLVAVAQACTFERIVVAKSNLPLQLENLKTTLIALMQTTKSSGSWQEWTEPKKLSIADAKKGFSSTLFIKIRGRIHPSKLLARQTGYWKIAETKRSRIKQVIVVHNDMVSAVFEKPKWHKQPHGKHSYTATPITDSILLGNQITDWKTRQTITYSADLYQK